jgi:hypothetical protein
MNWRSQPIHANLTPHESLDDAVRRLRMAAMAREYPLLVTDQRLIDAPYSEYLSVVERDRLRFVSWRFQQGDER